MSGLVTLPFTYIEDASAGLSQIAAKPWFAFLDSCVQQSTGGRYDILTANPRMTITTSDALTRVSAAGAAQETDEDPFQVLGRVLAERRCDAHDLPFVGGALGYFSYDLGRRIERLPSLALKDIDIPDMAVGIYDWAAIFDHLEQRAWIVAQPDCVEDLENWASILSHRLPVTPAAYGTTFQVTSSVTAETTFEQYTAAFNAIKHYILEGDCYQVNLAQRFSASCTGSPWDAYRRLRTLNPAPFSAYFAVPDGAVLSSSPERFLQVNKGRVETKPIKGTRPRSTDPATDKQLAIDLKNSEKDRAENLMIVDLLRNDISKSCAVGSVETPELFAIESFATVHHLVSTVRGTLDKDHEPTDLLRGCFPGGSITGAPKLRAMEIIEELEPCRRAVYCGAIGYLSFDGTMDTNIAIRTLVHYKDRMYCWAGGGIVADSELEAEFRECLDKASAMLNVFNHAEAQYLDR